VGAEIGVVILMYCLLLFEIYSATIFSKNFNQEGRMSLTQEDLQSVKEIVREIVHESETRLRKDLGEEINQFRIDVRDEFASVRSIILGVKEDIKQLREDLEFEGENRVSDSDAAFSEITKYLERIKKLEARVAKLEKTSV